MRETQITNLTPCTDTRLVHSRSEIVMLLRQLNMWKYSARQHSRVDLTDGQYTALYFKQQTSLVLFHRIKFKFQKL